VCHGSEEEEGVLQMFSVSFSGILDSVDNSPVDVDFGTLREDSSDMVPV
jgi:hypothetical protein